jgi:DNA-binding response OmpR family regulator
MKLLIIEDNQLLADSLKHALKASFIVDVAHTGNQALDLAATTEYAVVLLDLNLPDTSGYAVCRQLREKGITSPILVATGIKDTARCVQLLDAGADDYITKPYSLAILKARIRALLRRNTTIHDDETITVGGLTLHPASRRVVRDGVTIELRKKEFDILEYLIRNQGRAVTRSMILNHVWEAGKETWNNTVDVHIKYLRDKIDKPFKTSLIKTAHGVGYMVDNSS